MACSYEPLKKRVESVVDLALELTTPLGKLKYNGEILNRDYAWRWTRWGEFKAVVEVLKQVENAAFDAGVLSSLNQSQVDGEFALLERGGWVSSG